MAHLGTRWHGFARIWDHDEVAAGLRPQTIASVVRGHHAREEGSDRDVEFGQAGRCFAQFGCRGVEGVVGGKQSMSIGDWHYNFIRGKDTLVARDVLEDCEKALEMLEVEESLISSE